MSWAPNVANIGQKINEFRALMMNFEGEWQLGIPSLRWENNIKTDWLGLDSYGLWLEHGCCIVEHGNGTLGL